MAAFEYRRLERTNRKRRGREKNMTSGYDKTVKWTDRATLGLIFYICMYFMWTKVQMGLN